MKSPHAGPSCRHAWRSQAAQCVALAALLIGTRSEAAEAPSSRPESRGGTTECEATAAGARAACPEPNPCEALAPNDPSALQRSAAIGASLVPGAILHGAGSFVLGRSCTAERLFVLEGVGLGLLAVGGGAIVLTGAARNIVGPAAAVTIAGIGLFGLSMLADVYSVTAPGGGWGRAPTGVPRWEASLGYRYVYDPQFAYRHLLVNRVDARSGRWRLSPSLWTSPDDANERTRLAAAFRPWGATVDEHAPDGSFVDAELALTNHRFARESFEITTIEASLLGRVDLGRYDAGLGGSFADFGLGAATEVYDWEADPSDRQSENMLLARLGFGAYLGRQTPAGGYVVAYYDHRHDGYAGGVLPLGLGSGVAGHFGVETVYFFDDRFGLELAVEYGSAWVAGLSARFRAGGTQ